MQAKNLEFVIAQATDEAQQSAIGRAVAASVEVGVVVPSILKAKLAAEKLEVVEDVAALAEYGFATLQHLDRVVIKDKKGSILAMGAADGHGEALLHAVLGYFRENPVAGSDVPEGIAEIPAPIG